MRESLNYLVTELGNAGRDPEAFFKEVALHQQDHSAYLTMERLWAYNGPNADPKTIDHILLRLWRNNPTMERGKLVRQSEEPLTSCYINQWIDLNEKRSQLQKGGAELVVRTSDIAPHPYGWYPEMVVLKL